MEFIIRVTGDTKETALRGVILQDGISEETRTELFAMLQPGVYKYINDPSFVLKDTRIEPALPTADDFAKLLPTVNMFEDEDRHAKKERFREPSIALPPVETLTRDVHIQGRNDLCSCGSGKKYKNCHKNSY